MSFQLLGHFGLWCVSPCGRQKTMDIFLYLLSTFILLGQGLSQNLKLTSTARLVGQREILGSMPHCCVTGRYSHSWLISVRIQTQVLKLAEQVLLPTEPSAESYYYRFSFFFPKRLQLWRLGWPWTHKTCPVITPWVLGLKRVSPYLATTMTFKA